jgi:hypothetical protein
VTPHRSAWKGRPPAGQVFALPAFLTIDRLEIDDSARKAARLSQQMRAPLYTSEQAHTAILFDGMMYAFDKSAGCHSRSVPWKLV